MTRRPALRIAARDARRAKARSLLIVAMIALPVVALGFADVMWRTAEPNADESLARDLGSTQATLFMNSAPDSGLLQAADPRDGSFVTTGDSQAQPLDVSALRLPAGSSLLTERGSRVGVTTRTGVAPLDWLEVRVSDPAFAGRWKVVEGRAPASSGEVLLTPAMAARASVPIGGTLTLTDPVASFTVVGIVERSGARDLLSIVADPGTLIGRPDGIPEVEAWGTAGFVVGAPVSWTDVLALNAQGAVVTSRAVLANPPAITEFDAIAASWQPSFADFFIPVLIGTMVVGLAGLEVVLLAGAAFAVGARRQAHTLALVAASGGDRRDLRRVVLSSGVVLGIVAGVLGVALGVLTAAIATVAIHLWFPQVDLARFDVRLPELVLIAMVGVVTGILAAVVPARHAARLDVVAALRGRSGAPARPLRTPMIGVVMVGIGVALSVLGSGWAVSAANTDGGTSSSTRTWVIVALVAGAAFVLLGLVVCSGSIVSLAARLAPRLPLAGRLALRDSDRHRGRSAPAVAAVLAAVSGSVAVMLYVAATDEYDRQSYSPSSPSNTATVNLVNWSGDVRGAASAEVKLIDPAAATRAVSDVLPVSGSLALHSTGACADVCAQVTLVRPQVNQCPLYQEGYPDPAEANVVVAPEVPDDPRCSQPPTTAYWNLPFGSPFVVGGPEVLDASGVPASPAARQVLAAGGVVVTDPLLLDANGMVRLDFTSAAAWLEGPPPGEEDTWIGPKPDEIRHVPGIVVPPDQTIVNQVISTEALRGLDVKIAPTTLLVQLSGPVSTDQEDAARSRLLGAFGEATYFNVERGYQSTYGLGLLALALAAGIVTLGATGIATGLALTDARADHATLAAIGAAPRLRRRLAGAQSLVIGFLGVTLGIVAGVVPALSIIGAAPALTVVWPVPQLLIVLVGVPLLAGAAAYVCTRSKVPLQRRVVA